MTREPVHNSAMTEADTCRDFVTPKIVQAGWSDAPFAIGEQRSFTNGRIFVAGGKVRRGKQRRADYILFYRRDFPLAVVEAKEAGLPAENGVQQAREYAEALGLKFAYATNGHRIIEIDYLAGTEREVERYASPEELFARLTAGVHLPPAAAPHLLEPFNLASGKVPRYYQQIRSTAWSKLFCSARSASWPPWPPAPARPSWPFRFAGRSGAVAGTAQASTGARRFFSWPTVSDGANPLLNAGEGAVGIKANFPPNMQTAETALLFLQYIMRKLRVAGAPGGGQGRG